LDSTIPLAPPAEPPKYYRLLAPWWHTVTLVAVMLIASFGQAHRLGPAVHQHGRLLLYVFTIVYEWTLVGFVWLGIHRRGLRFRDLIGGRWKSPEDFLLDVGLAFGCWIALLLMVAVMRFALGQISFDPARNMEQAKEIQRTIGFLAPLGLRETVLYAALSATAGFCEELIFRGYLQKQFHAATRSAFAAVVAQALLFGAVHAYQGLNGMLVVTTLGTLLGVLAFWRRSLRPGMMTHAWLDFFSGLALRYLASQLR